MMLADFCTKPFQSSLFIMFCDALLAHAYVYSISIPVSSDALFKGSVEKICAKAVDEGAKTVDTANDR
jgi:hypothetical protein